MKTQRAFLLLPLLLLGLPLIISASSLTEITPSDGFSNDHFGHSVSSSGGLVVVGARVHDPNGVSNQGAAYVFNCTSSLSCMERSKLVAGDGDAWDSFGNAVAISGSLVVVGAYQHDTDGSSNQGAAYVFDCSSFPCLQRSKLTGSDATDSNFFGWSVSAWSTMVVVTSPTHNSIGAAYVYDCSSFPCVERDKLTPSDGQVNDNFGGATSIYGDLVVVGAALHDANSNPDQGAAYLFRCSSFPCIEEDKIFAASGVTEDLFGSSVAIWQSLVVVGAKQQDPSARVTNQGAAYIFDCSSTPCTEMDKFFALDGEDSDFFGGSVSFFDGLVLVGAEAHGSGAPGAAYLFDCSSFSCSQVEKFFLPDAEDSDFFGFSVSISSELAVIGAPFRHFVGKTDQGAAYVLDASPFAPTTQPPPSTCASSKVFAPGQAESEAFGFSIAISGSKVVVGAPFHDLNGDELSQGAAFVFDCSSWPCSQVAKLTSSDLQSFSTFGHSVSISDSGVLVLVGAPQQDDTYVSQGAVFVFGCSSSFCSQIDVLMASDGFGMDSFGHSVSFSGSLAVVGAPQHEPGSLSNQGAAYIFDCSSIPCQEKDKLVAADGGAGDNFGYSVSMSGFFVVVGARSHRPTSLIAQGAAYVFDCTSFPCSERSKLVASDGAGGDFFGTSVSISGTLAIAGVRKGEACCLGWGSLR